MTGVNSLIANGKCLPNEIRHTCLTTIKRTSSCERFSCPQSMSTPAMTCRIWTSSSENNIRWVWLWVQSHLPSRPPKDQGVLSSPKYGQQPHHPYPMAALWYPRSQCPRSGVTTNHFAAPKSPLSQRLTHCWRGTTTATGTVRVFRVGPFVACLR